MSRFLLHCQFVVKFQAIVFAVEKPNWAHLAKFHRPWTQETLITPISPLRLAPVQNTDKPIFATQPISLKKKHSNMLERKKTTHWRCSSRANNSLFCKCFAIICHCHCLPLNKECYYQFTTPLLSSASLVLYLQSVLGLES